MLWRSPGSDAPPNRPRAALLRVLPVMCLYGLALGLWQYGLHQGSRLPRWTDLPPTKVVYGDVLYRGALGLQAALGPGAEGAGTSVDPEDLMQAGLGAYEWAGLRKENPDPAALLRLAVIYSARGYREQGRELLVRLMQADETRTPLYLALSGVYDDRALSAAEVREAWELLSAADPWPSQLALVDLYRRAGDEQGARAARLQAEANARAFTTAALWLACAYLVLALAGLWLVVRWLITAIFGLPRPGPMGPPPVRWEALDALEAAGVVLLAAVVLGQMASAAAQRWELPTRAPALDAALGLAAYVVICGSALWVMRHRVAQAGQRLGLALGLGGRPGLRHLWQALGGYGVLIACAVLAGTMARSWGLPLGTVAPGADGPASPGALGIALYLLMTCVLAPLAEEAIFRGYVFAALRRIQPIPIAAVSSAILFAGAHLSLGGPGLVAVFGMGLVLAYLYQRSGSLWPCVLAHAIHNLLAFAVLMTLNS